MCDLVSAEGLEGLSGQKSVPSTNVCLLTTRGAERAVRSVRAATGTVGGARAGLGPAPGSPTGLMWTERRLSTVSHSGRPALPVAEPCRSAVREVAAHPTQNATEATDCHLQGPVRPVPPTVLSDNEEDLASLHQSLRAGLRACLGPAPLRLGQIRDLCFDH